MSTPLEFRHDERKRPDVTFTLPILPPRTIALISYLFRSKPFPQIYNENIETQLSIPYRIIGKYKLLSLVLSGVRLSKWPSL